MATFNGEDYIKEQILSILDQLSSEDELLISDDGSTDGTLSIISKINDTRIELLHGSRLGLIENFKNAVSHATGDIIFLADQDDIWIEDRLNQSLVLHQRYGVVAVDLDVFSDLDGVKAHIGKFSNLIHPADSLLRTIFFSCHPGCAISFSRKYIDFFKHLSADAPMHDWPLVIYSYFQGDFIFSGKVGIKYRRHANNFSQSGEKSMRSLFSKCLDRYLVIKVLLKYLFR